MKVFQLRNSTKKIPALGFGTWQIPPEEVGGIVSEAIKTGYKHIDCAHVYANEEKLGQDCFAHLKEKRDELYIVSKLWSDSHEPTKVASACQLTLKNLQLDYLDLYLVHNPIRLGVNESGVEGSKYYTKEWIVETWREMEKLYERGLVKNIGVSNFSTTKLQWLLDEASIKPAVNQVELHPYLPQSKLLKFCDENNIHLTAYSPLGSKTTRELFFGNKEAKVLLEDEIINSIAIKNKISAAQVLISWGLNRGTSLLVKSANEKRLKDNFEAQQITLPKEDIECLNNISYRARYLTFDVFLTPGKTLDDYWDNEYLL